MPTSEEIVASIDQRLLLAAEEIRQLEAARHALSGSAGARPTRTPNARAVRLAGATKTGGASSKHPATGTRRRRSKTSTVDADQLQTTLSTAKDGLSAARLAEQIGGERPRVLALLRQLEASGHVRRSGARRTTRWHVITDEERIARRAAELPRAAERR